MAVADFAATNPCAVERAGVDEPWATIRAGDGTALFVNAGNYLGYAERGATTGRWSRLMRLLLAFDTSTLGPGVVVDAATVTLIAFVATNAGGINQPAGALYPLQMGTPGQPAISDFERIGTTKISNTVPFLFWTPNDPLTFVLNPGNLDAINPLGWSMFGGRFIWDGDGTVPPDWNAFSLGVWTGDPTKRPMLSVTYHIPAGAVPDQRIDIDAAVGTTAQLAGSGEDELHLTAIIGGLAP